MKKKTLCGLLSLVMLTGAYPVSAFANEDINILKNSLDFREAEEDMAGDGWEWEENDHTLTLDGFRYAVPTGMLDNKAAIYLPQDSYVEIEGDDNILTGDTAFLTAFSCEGEVNFSGDGKMELNMDSRGSTAFYVENGPISFDDEVEFTIESKGYIVYLKHPKGDEPRVIIEDDAKLIFHKDYHISRNIMLVVKYNDKESDNWLDYAEVVDDWDEDYIHLVARDSEEALEAEKEKEAETAVPEEPAAPEAPSAEEPVKQSEYQIVIGNKAIQKDGYVTYVSDAAPYLSRGYTMLPLRALLSVTDPDLNVKWDAKTRTATVAVNGKTIVIPVDADEYSKGETSHKYYTQPELTEGRLFISLRDWMDLMDIETSQLSWDAKTKTVTMKY